MEHALATNPKTSRFPAAPTVRPTLTAGRPTLHRKCACGGTHGPAGKCLPGFAPPSVHKVLGSPGQPLSADTRAYFEPRLRHEFGQVAPHASGGMPSLPLSAVDARYDEFEREADTVAQRVLNRSATPVGIWHDLSGVRIHTGGDAAESAKAVNAHAYTVGEDIVFGAGQYAPGTTSGRFLLAHELVHTLQPTGPIRRRVAGPGTPEGLARKARDAFRGLGTDEQEVYRILSVPPDQVRAMINYYNDHLNTHTGKGFIEDVKDEFSGRELAKAMQLLGNAQIDTHTAEKTTRIRSSIPGEPNKLWVGLIVRGMWSKEHEPGVMEQHADVVVPGVGGKMATRGYFGDQPGVAGSSAESRASTGLGLPGISADMAWFLANRRPYVDLELAKLLDMKSSLILLKVTLAQAALLNQYWQDLKADPQTFYILGKNCSTAAAAGFEHAALSKEIRGLDTPDNLFQQLRKQYSDAFMISGYYGYTRTGLRWEFVAGRPRLRNPGAGSWNGPFVVEKRLT